MPISHQNLAKIYLHPATTSQFLDFNALSRGIVLNDKHFIIFQPDTGAESINLSFTYHSANFFSFEELTYFLEHPDYAQIWLASCEDRSGRHEFFAACQENHCIPSSVLA